MPSRCASRVGWGVGLEAAISVGVGVAGNQSIVGVGVNVWVGVAVGGTGVGEGFRLLHPDTHIKLARKSIPKIYFKGVVF